MTQITKKGNMNIHRVEKHSILTELLEEVQANDISTENLSILEQWLKKNVEGMKEIDQNSILLFKENKDEVIENALDAFQSLQKAIETMDTDSHSNEWRCQFSNRVMHKSKKTADIKRRLVQSQKEIFSAIDLLCGSAKDRILNTGENSNDWILDSIEEFNFYVR